MNKLTRDYYSTWERDEAIAAASKVGATAKVIDRSVLGKGYRVTVSFPGRSDADLIGVRHAYNKALRGA